MYSSSEQHRVGDVFWDFKCATDFAQQSTRNGSLIGVSAAVGENATLVSDARTLPNFTASTVEWAERTPFANHREMENELNTRYLLQLSSQMLTILDGSTNFLILFCSNSRYRHEFKQILQWDRVAAGFRKIGSLRARLRLQTFRGNRGGRRNCHCDHQEASFNLEMFQQQQASHNSHYNQNEQLLLGDYRSPGRQPFACYRCEQRCGKPKSLSTLGIGWPLEQTQKKETQRPGMLQHFLQMRPNSQPASSSSSNRQRAGGLDWPNVRVVAKLHPSGHSSEPYCLIGPNDNNNNSNGESSSHAWRRPSERASFRSAQHLLCNKEKDAASQKAHSPRFRCRFESPPHSLDAAADSCGAECANGGGGTQSGRNGGNGETLRYYVWRSRSYAICQMERTHSRSREREHLRPPLPASCSSHNNAIESRCRDCTHCGGGGRSCVQKQKKRRRERDSSRSSDEELHALHSHGHLNARRHTRSNSNPRSAGSSSHGEGLSFLRSHEPDSNASCFTEPILVAIGNQSALGQTPAVEMRSVV